MDKAEEVEELKPVGGLIDPRILVSMTGANPNSVRQWIARASGKNPDNKGSAPAWFPPVIGTLNGGAVFRAKDLDVELARESMRKPGRPSKPPKDDASE